MDSMEEQINKTIESLNGIHRAESNPFLYGKVMQRINNNGIKTLPGRYKIIWQVAAVVAFLISFNLLTLFYFSKSSDLRQDNVATIANEYFSYMVIIKF